MDIFTTALTRVVPVPIKPASLKVKALMKAAATHAVSDDTAGLEEPALYFKKSSDQEESTDKPAPEVVEATPVPADNTGQHIDVFEDSECTHSEKDDKPHLDIFV
ncbi:MULTISPECIES: hypothetical protein [unclassified Colwellia]|uniref:hypothetical protein n=1 Tax=unclassified Colwellia TaxID=196834 RepID=UPI0015F6BA25|nr:MULTISPECIES: hypothetical protein [unclassified Colwellia]MBA6290052.1 hypothetical protein [Colwellia sp. MB3u-4]MBA6296531.1 hypothetical protein [Colwellia sp. MB02u-9]